MWATLFNHISIQGQHISIVFGSSFPVSGRRLSTGAQKNHNPMVPVCRLSTPSPRGPRPLDCLLPAHLVPRTAHLFPNGPRSVGLSTSSSMAPVMLTVNPSASSPRLMGRHLLAAMPPSPCGAVAISLWPCHNLPAVVLLSTCGCAAISLWPCRHVKSTLWPCRHVNLHPRGYAGMSSLLPCGCVGMSSLPPCGRAGMSSLPACGRTAISWWLCRYLLEAVPPSPCGRAGMSSLAITSMEQSMGNQ